MSPITTHVLDTARGRPAASVPVILEFRAGETGWKQLGHGKTDADGRAKELLPTGARLEAGTYRLRFDAAVYFRAQGIESFHPEIVVEFLVREAARHYHVPLLMSPYSYTTYRGS
jgi:5-hydroxyisourate hydrolase